ncbi:MULTISPECIES: CHC2 zinc finger domain-containing protein [unclassified Novosphingobium]|uniref:CHC2 zinc finger domain-containing protein n=1 Tax=unclassified Novosphingobium TaxID=2644732 RepID=UPI001356C6CC|nr:MULTISPECIES: CHC2 zinc finger domain-containing protein [unclassified Novosphingobium]
MGRQAAQPSGRLSDDEFRELVNKARERHSISDIIGRHTQLKKRGGGRDEQVGLCPFHSERTPSFEVNDTKGTYHCWGCGAAGDAITFLVNCEGLSFRAAVETLSGDAFPVISEEERTRRKREIERASASRIALARTIWSRSIRATLDTPAGVYARSRGITIDLPPTVRFVMTPRWYDPETGEAGRDIPAMACALQDVTGAVVGVQCVFLEDGGRRKYSRPRPDGSIGKAKLSFGQIVGSALRLGPVRPHLINCEGPEDGLTLAQRLPDKSVWVTCGTAMLSRVDYPTEVRSVCFAGDNNDAGRLAVTQARDAVIAKGLIPSEAFPPADFKDWNDELRGVRA